LRSALQTDRPCFRRLVADAAEIIQLRELVCTHEELTEEFGRLTNRLREQVHRIAPEWLTLSSNADDPWFWALLEYAASPAAAKRLRRSTVSRLLRQHRIRRVTADEVLRVLKAPAVYVAPGTVEATVRHIAGLVARVQLVDTQQRECAKDLEALLTALAAGPQPAPPAARSGDTSSPAAPNEDAASETGPSDVAIVWSLPGAGIINVSALFAEAGHAIRDANLDALRALTGSAPVTRRTGRPARRRVPPKRHEVSMRRACNPRLRNAVYHLARVSTRLDAAARSYYAVLRARGHGHGRALRSVADRWLRILTSMLRTRTLYDPTRFSMTESGGVPAAAAT
jgi:transposase